MKTIVVVAHKGGVAKSATSVMLAQYAALSLHKRVLFIDTDAQGNSGDTIARHSAAHVSHVPASHVFTQPSLDIESSLYTLLRADRGKLRVLEQEKEMRNEYGLNFRLNMMALDDSFDLCIVDTAPNPDIRLLSALCSADAAISPLELNQEAVSGMVSLMKDRQTGVNVIKNGCKGVNGLKDKLPLNPKLDFLGFLPSKVEQNNLQRSNMEILLKDVLPFMFVSKEGRPMLIKKCTAVAEAMQTGVPIFHNKSGTTASKAWKLMKPVFDEIITRVIGKD